MTDPLAATLDTAPAFILLHKVLSTVDVPAGWRLAGQGMANVKAKPYTPRNISAALTSRDYFFFLIGDVYI